MIVLQHHIYNIPINPRILGYWFEKEYMTIKIIQTPIKKSELLAMAQGKFGEFIKAVVDIEKGIMAIDADLHADEETLMLEQGSLQKHLWGINIYPQRNADDMIEFDSMINMRPGQGNNSRGVEDATVREKILIVVRALIQE